MRWWQRARTHGAHAHTHTPRTPHTNARPKVWSNFRQCTLVGGRQSKGVATVRFQCRFCDEHWAAGKPKNKGEEGPLVEHSNTNYSKKTLRKHFNEGAAGSKHFPLWKFNPDLILPPNTPAQDLEVHQVGHLGMHQHLQTHGTPKRAIVHLDAGQMPEVC